MDHTLTEKGQENPRIEPLRDDAVTLADYSLCRVGDGAKSGAAKGLSDVPEGLHRR